MDLSHWGLEVNDDDRLMVSGCDVVGLTEELGSPLHVVAADVLQENHRRFERGLAGQLPDVRIFSSYKTNCIPGVQQLLHQAGCGAEVISPYEFWLAGELGVAPRNIIYNGPNKSVADLRRAVEVGVGLINVDSEAELDRLILAARQAGIPANLGIRLRAPSGWGAQFGELPRSDVVLRLLHKAEASGILNLCGLQLHCGTGMRSPDTHVRAVTVACRIQAEVKQHFGRSLPLLDLGGGFGVPTVRVFALWETALYRLLGRPPSVPLPGRCATPEQFGDAIGKRLVQSCETLGLDLPSVLLEPGRALTSSAQMLLVTVRDVKRLGHRSFAMTDGGMQNIAFPLSYEYHHCVLANRVHAPRSARYRIVGPLCSPEDVLYRNWSMPVLREGDVLAVLDAGAYFTSFGNNFGYPRPAVAIVSEGRATVTRARESFAHLSALDLPLRRQTVSG